MTKKSKQILTDTVVIVGAHEIACWESLCNAYQIVIPATILEKEAFYFESDRDKIGMNPTKWIDQGKIQRIEAELEDIENLLMKLSPDFAASLDQGELEALALLMSKKHKELLFTTSDRAAIKALGVLGIGYKGISLEELLKNKGIKFSKNKKLPYQFTKNFLVVQLPKA